MATNPALSSALTDVRKAYRLLWSYQKRIYDIVTLLAGEFEDIEFYWWSILHAERPCKSGTNPMSRRWAWDMLPMVQVSYLFLPSDADRNLCMPGQWMLEIHVNSDSGFKDPKDRNEPDPETFTGVAESASYLAMYVWYCTAQSGLNWFSDVWMVTNWPAKEGDVAESSDPPFKVFGKKVDLLDLPDRDAVKSLAALFKNEASKALGVTLEPDR